MKNLLKFQRDLRAAAVAPPPACWRAKEVESMFTFLSPQKVEHKSSSFCFFYLFFLAFVVVFISTAIRAMNAVKTPEITFVISFVAKYYAAAQLTDRWSHTSVLWGSHVLSPALVSEEKLRGEREESLTANHPSSPQESAQLVSRGLT